MSFVNDWVNDAADKAQLAELLLTKCHVSGKDAEEGDAPCPCPTHAVLQVGDLAKEVDNLTEMAAFFKQTAADQAKDLADKTADVANKADQLDKLKNELAGVYALLSEKSTFASSVSKEAVAGRQTISDLTVKVNEQSEKLKVAADLAERVQAAVKFLS